MVFVNQPGLDSDPRRRTCAVLSFVLCVRAPCFNVMSDVMSDVMSVLLSCLVLYLRQVTQVQFRLQEGRTIARRFWLKDRVSLLFRFVRTTVRRRSRWLTPECPCVRVSHFWHSIPPLASLTKATPGRRAAKHRTAPISDFRRPRPHWTRGGGLSA